MTASAINRFYIFVATNSNYNGNWDNLRNDMDCLKHDGIITQAEFGQFITNEASELNFSRADILNVFSSININTKGKVKDHGDVYEQTGLNENEQKQIEANMQIYGEILENFKNTYASSSVNSTVSHYSDYGLTEDSVINTAFELLLGEIGLSSASELQPNDEKFKKFLKMAVAENLKDYFLENLQSMVDAELGTNTEYPGLAYDQNLRNLLENNIINNINASTDLSNISGKSIREHIEYTIKNYLATAGIGTQNNKYTQNAYSGKMNELQIARLEQYYKQEFSGIDDLDKYAGIIDAEAMINQFIEGKKEYWRGLDYTQFPSEWNNITAAVEEFKKTLEAADHVLEMLGFDEHTDIDNYIDGTCWVEEDGEKKFHGTNFYASKIMHDLYYGLGLQGAYGINGDNGEIGIDKFKSAISKCYDGFVKEAAKEILAHPDEYGLDLNNLNKNKLTDLITKYILEHNAEALLNAAGVDGKKKALAMIAGAEMICAQNGANQWTEEDAIEAALRVLEFFTKSPYGKNSKAYELLEECSLNTESVIRSSSAGTLRANLAAFFQKAQNVDLTKQITPTGGTGGANGGSGVIDKVTNPIGTGIMESEWRTLASNDYGNKSLRASAIGNVRSALLGITTALANNPELDSTLVGYAYDNTLAYFSAFINAWKDQSSGDLQDLEYTGLYNSSDGFNFEYDYTDASGQTHKESGGSVTYSHTADYRKDWIRQNKTSSSSGIYIYEWDCMFGNQYCIAIDKGAIWDKFREFYNKLCE